jgi:hypothetical protein
MDNMKFEDYVHRFPEHAGKQSSDTLRQWKRRGSVPGHVTRSLMGAVTGPEGVTKSVTKSEGVTSSVTKPAGVFIDGIDVSDVTEAYATDRGYVVDKPHSWPYILGIFASSRVAIRKMDARKALGLEVVSFGSKPELDLLSDGWLRGLPGDTNLMRKFRTEQQRAFVEKGIEGSVSL